MYFCHQGIVHNMVTYNQLISIHCRSPVTLEEGFRLFHEMENENLKPNTYNQFLKNKYFDFAFSA